MAEERYSRYDHQDDGKLADGWYACGVCYDPNEGVLPYSLLYASLDWNALRYVITMVSGPYLTKEEADSFLDKRDPDVHFSDYTADI